MIELLNAPREESINDYVQTLTSPDTLYLPTGEQDYSREQTPLHPDDIVIAMPYRTGIGSFGGSLAGIPATELGAKVASAIFEEADIREAVDTVVVGQVLQVGSKMNPARQIGINSGVPVESTAYTVNKVCGSGMKAVVEAAKTVKLREDTGVEVALAGGIENMSRTPHYLATNGRKIGLGDFQAVDTVVEGLTDVFSGEHMGITAEKISKQYGLTRESIDAYSARSQARAALANEADYYKGNIVPVGVRVGRKVVEFATDEYVRGGTTAEGLAKLRPAFDKEGIVTAGNASGINDGASMMIVTTARRAQELGLQPSMRLVSYAEAGVDPSVMGLGPIPASRRALGRAGLNVGDIDFAEINEAFASVSVISGYELGLTDEQLNPTGGAVAHGHPIGATGSILLSKMDSHFNRNPKARFGLASLCIGGGEGIAMVVENVRNK